MVSKNWLSFALNGWKISLFSIKASARVLRVLWVAAFVCKYTTTTTTLNEDNTLRMSRRCK